MRLEKVGKSKFVCLTSGERGFTTIVVRSMNARGNYVPPMIVFKRKRMIESLKDGTPPGSVIVNNERNELFVVWLKHFVSQVGCTKDRPVLLILDGHWSHTKNTEAIQYARDHGVVILSLPPHTTRRLQPLDRVFYKSLMAYYIHECDSWLRTDKSPVTISSVCRILGRAYLHSVSILTAVIIFKCSGLVIGSFGLMQISPQLEGSSCPTLKLM